MNRVMSFEGPSPLMCRSKLAVARCKGGEIPHGVTAGRPEQRAGVSNGDERDPSKDLEAVNESFSMPGSGIN